MRAMQRACATTLNLDYETSRHPLSRAQLSVRAFLQLPVTLDEKPH